MDCGTKGGGDHLRRLGDFSLFCSRTRERVNGALLLLALAGWVLLQAVVLPRLGVGT